MVYKDPVSNPYDPTSKEWEPQTPPLDEIVRNFVRGEFLKLRVMMPCQVTAVSGGLVSVQPGFQTRFTFSNKVQNLPVIQNVPIGFIQGADFLIKVPVAVKDTGWLIFSDRNLDPWLSGSGASVDPADSRSHDISDCIFLPGLVVASAQTKDATTDILIMNGKAIFRVQKAGTFVARNQTNELLDVLDQIAKQTKLIASTLSTDTVNTMFGPMQLNAFSTYANIATTLQDLITKLETLKGS